MSFLRQAKIRWMIVRLSSQTKNPYGHTVLLPKTSFAMKLEGSKRLEMDERILNSKGFYEESSSSSSSMSEPFILHDGPPYANGSTHLGHAINKILKDVIVRRQREMGKTVHFRPGWDCHGLPIELKAAKTERDPLKIRRKSREFAEKTVKSQMKEFQSWGVSADWSNPYLTMSPDYIRNQFSAFYHLYERGHVFRDLMPVYWSPSSGTALAESELEYADKTSAAVFVKFKLINRSSRDYVLVWTTTPWSLTANKAVCYAKNEVHYVFVTVDGGDRYLVASNAVSRLPFPIVGVSEYLSDEEISTLRYKNVRNEICHFFPADHVTATSGTGLVHTAPGHGHDDFKVGKLHGLEPLSFVNNTGQLEFESEDDVLYALNGVSISDDDRILDYFKDIIVHRDSIVHSYPHDWRTKKPVVIKVSKQWFVNTLDLSQRASKFLSTSISIVPSSRMSYFRDNLVNRPYWCISRQRVWGVPIPAFYKRKDDSPVINEELIRRYQNLIDSKGTDFWWSMSDKEILQSTEINADDVYRNKDILDVWFDSGISWSTLGGRKADLYLEGHDQFNGWFYSSLITSVAIRNEAPFKKIFVHGFALDEDGRKMSKSLGNVVSPSDIIRGGSRKFKNIPFGVDVLRYWVAAHASSRSSSNVVVSESVFTESKRDVDKIRNALRFCLGNIETTLNRHPECISISMNLFSNENEIPMLDRYMRHRLTELDALVSSYYDHDDEMSKVCRTVSHFITNDVSSLYFHCVKDRLYCDSLHSIRRRSAITILSLILQSVLRWMGPILPILQYEIRQNMKSFGNPDFNLETTSVLENVETLLKIKSALRNSNYDQSKLELDLKPVTKKGHRTVEKKNLEDIREILQVVNVTTSSNETSVYDFSTSDFEVRVKKTDSFLCPRCKLYQSHENDALCSRCFSVIDI